MAQYVEGFVASKKQTKNLRMARRYLRRNNGQLARILNSYKDAQAKGTCLGYLAQQ